MTTPYTIAVCDDHELVRLSMRAFLEQHGFRVLAVSDGHSLLDELDGSAVRLVFLDLQMPGLGGMDVLREIRSRGSEVHVVLMSAVEKSSEVAEAYRLGAIGWLTKPFDLDRALDAARQHLSLDDGT